MTKSDCQYIRGLVRTKQNVPGSFQQRAVENHVTKCEACRQFFQQNPEYILAAQLGIEMPLLDVVTLRSQRVLRRRRTPVKGMQRLSNEKRATLVKQSKPIRKAIKSPKPVHRGGRQRKPAIMMPHMKQVLHSLYYMGIGVVVAFLLYYAVQTGARFNTLARIYENLGIISVATTASPATPTETDVPIAPTQPLVPVEPNIATINTGDDKALTILLLGTDRRPQESAPARSDTILLMRIVPESQHISLLSLPRDLMVDIPGYGVARINAAHVYGDLYRSLGSGMSLATKTVSNVVGVPIDYTVVIDFQGFISAIDALGGVPVSVPTALYDANFPTMEYGVKEVSFAPGQNTMDGYTALVYSRIRHPDNDFERMMRQQAVLKGILLRLQQGGFLAQVDSTAAITDALVRHARTDAPRDVIITLAWHMRNASVDGVRSVVFRDVYYGSGADQYAMFPVDGALERSVAEWMKSP
ncbi:MAG: LCP family protein [Chloroflexota bacterium]|jgi:LCP family protein required for cell wall assembly